MSAEQLNHRAHMPAAAVPPQDANDGAASTARALPMFSSRPGKSAPPPTGPLLSALEEATRCIQCGFCLPACPTYKVFGEEKHSPRGRIQLVKSWAESGDEPSVGLLEALDLCLDCRACEVACPIEVKYSTVLYGARDELAARAEAPETSSFTQRLQGKVFRQTLRTVAKKPSRLRALTGLGHRVLRSAPGRWVRQRIERRPQSWLASALVFADALPRPAAPPPRASSRDVQGERAMLFLGCAQEGMFPETNRSTKELLERAGFRVELPTGQGCCGALAGHHGDKEHGRELVRQNMHAFGAYDEQNDTPIVMNAGGCMAWLKEAPALFEPGTRDYAAAQRLANRLRDISEILVDAAPTQEATGQGAAHLQTVPPGHAASLADAQRPTGRRERADVPPANTTTRKPVRVIYQPSCHLSNVCGVRDEPLALLQRITGGNASLPPDGGSCCGSAGIYNALHPQASRAILDKKMQSIAENPPDVIVTSNPGCQLQMLAGVRAAGLEGKVRVMQLAEFVREYGTDALAGDDDAAGLDTNEQAQAK